MVRKSSEIIRFLSLIVFEIHIFTKVIIDAQTMYHKNFMQIRDALLQLKLVKSLRVLHELGDITSACARSIGVIYALNLSDPQELKAFFEVIQKCFPQLDTKLTKVQILKNKLYE
uniref:Uncharacterized protein n=1 Tax=Amphilophus citrinellus TaxID=61819 RepID=A0A3Q0RJ05_AMPCI